MSVATSLTEEALRVELVGIGELLGVAVELVVQKNDVGSGRNAVTLQEISNYR